MQKSFLLIIIFSSLIISSCNAQEGKELLNKEEQVEVFEHIWELVNNNFYDENFNGINWNKKRDEYLKLITNSSQPDSLFPILNSMLFELNSSHTGVGLISNLKNETSPYIFSTAEIGIDLRIVNDEIFITKVKESSPADMAGLKVGYVIKSVDGKTLEHFKNSYKSKPPYNSRNIKFHLTSEVLRNIYGESNTSVELGVIDHNKKYNEVKMNRTHRLNPVALSVGMPDLFIEFESRNIKREILYIKFNAFQSNSVDRAIAFIRAQKKTKGIILDLRGNDGGSVDAMKNLIANFIDRRIVYGNYINRDGSREEFIDPAKTKIEIPIIVLVDELSISAAENTAGILQYFNLATIVGMQTPGQMLWGNGYFINDDIFLAIPIYKLEYPNGYNPENNGIVPDVEVKLNVDDLMHGKDTQLERAIELLSK